jgi:uncharacterized protein (TIGR02145 family)/uncharacterized repeat protein (TIGR02543 family)
MRRFRLPIIIVLAVSFLLFLVLHCGDIATDPFSQEKANVSLHLISSDFVESDTAITDTIDKKMRLGVCLYLTQHIDSTVITIGKNITSLDTAFSCAYKDQQVDTVYYTFSFPAAGDRTVIATAYVGKSLRQTATATIHILARPVPNQKPELSVLGNRDIIAGQTCALEVTAIDPDVGQTAIIEASHLPAGAAFDGHSFSWSTTLADTGTHTAVFIATDNGTPPLLDSAAITITVTAPGVNRPPKWNEDTIIRGIEPGTHFSLTLADQCSDPDNDTLHFALLPGAPAGDTVLNGIYSFTPSANDTGVFFPRIAAFDPQNASDTMTVKLTITPLDNDTLPPIITRFDPVKDSTSTNANSYTVKVTCKDPSGVASVIYTLGEATFPAQKDAGDTIWSANVTDLVANTLNTITAIATDASLRANKDTLIISIKYDPTMTDSIGPMFYQKSGPATGSIVTDSIFSITDSIYDPSGIDSVYWTLNNNNSKPLTPVLRTTNKYSLTDTLRQFHLNTIMIYAVDKATSHNKSSQTVILNYIVPPKITTQPVSQSVCPQASATFSVTASGTRPFAYQWNKGGTTISTDSTFTIDAVTSPDTGTYTVTITNPADTITSLPAVLTVKTASSKPTITPASPTTCPGSPITLHLSGGMLGTGASWKWYTGSCGATLAGSDSTLTVNPSVNTTYFVRAEGGCLTTDCAFTQVMVNTVPHITTQPVPQTLWVGDSATFSIVANGTTPLTYQWYRGFTPVGANNPSLKIKPLVFADSGNYTCIVTNACGMDTSQAGKLTVKPVFTVSFNTNEGSDVPSQTVKSDSLAKKPVDPTKSGYTFAEWYSDSALTALYNFSTPITGNKTLYAKWVVMDIDGNVYTTVKIGTQTWMVENLKTTRFNDSSEIQLVTDSAAWTSLNTAAYCWYNNDLIYKSNNYGALYNWYSVNTGKLAPKGWHVPSDTEWNILTTYLGGDNVAGGKMKEEGTIHWASPNTGASNVSGFTALPGGNRNHQGFISVGSFGSWWLSTENTDVDASRRYILNNSEDVSNFTTNSKFCGNSVRCIKN